MNNIRNWSCIALFVEDDGIKEYFAGPPGPPGPPGSLSDDDLANRVISYIQSEYLESAFS